MKYINKQADLKDVLIHLRNKNFSIFYGNTGFIQKIFNRISTAILRYQTKLNSSAGDYKLVITERIIETPLVFKYLRDQDETILDFGGFESILPLQLSALGYKVSVWDQRPYPFSHPNITVLCGDLFVQSREIMDRFDVIVSISVIEHLGLGNYGDQVVEDADKEGVKILWGLLKKGGRLMVSVPAGRPTIQRGYRVYNEEKIREVFPDIQKIYWYAKSGREGIWREVQGEALGNLVYSAHWEQSPVEGLAFIICEKKTDHADL